MTMSAGYSVHMVSKLPERLFEPLMESLFCEQLAFLCGFDGDTLVERKGFCLIERFSI